MITPGTRIGPYEVVAPLGAGGMGVVYRARDTRLPREVAIKVLPEAYARDPDRLRRFELEARAAGAVSHPSIVSTFDVGTHDGSPYLVTELLEGVTLRAELGRPLPPRRALSLAVQIAQGLAAAHEKGIVHRDLKPENLMVTRDGHLKILDFGLAKLTRRETGPREGRTLDSTAPLGAPETEPGAVLGTIGYMSPEQVRGLPVDHRADIFSFGTILYEMLAGERAFRGDSDVDTLYAIVHAQPPDLPDEGGRGPLSLVVRRCLEKDPEDRFQSARDLAFAMEALGAVTSVPAAGVPPMAPRVRPLLPWIAAAVLGLAAAVLALRPPRAAAPRPVRFEVLPPGGGELNFWDLQHSMALSPDGRQLAFSTLHDGRRQLYLRALDDPVPRPLAGTEQAGAPFWSPDGRSVAFFAAGKLKRVAAQGGPVQVLADAQLVGTGTWSPDGTILITHQMAIARVPEGGGTPERLDLATPEGTLLFWPSFLPDGRRFLVTGMRPAGRDRWVADVYVGAVGERTLTRVLEDGSRALHADGHLLFVREGTLSAQPFDPRSLRVSGAPEPMVAGVRSYYPTGGADFSAAGDGTLAYQLASVPRCELRWHSRDGAPLEAVAEGGDLTAVRISPDGRSAAVETLDPQFGSPDIWLHDLERRSALRFTTSPMRDDSPVFAPDGSRLYFASGGPPRVVAKGLGDSEAGAPLFVKGGRQHPLDVSPDGGLLIFETPDDRGVDDLWLFPLGGAAPEPRPFVTSPFREGQAAFSPDGRWVAHVSDESGSPEVYLRPLRPGEGGAVQRVSTGGGSSPRFRRDSTELFLESGGAVHAAALRQGAAGLVAAAPTRLFAPRGRLQAFDAAPDGQRFLVVSCEGPAVPGGVVVAVGQRLGNGRPR